MINIRQTSTRQGAVSLFIVVFATLLLSVVVLGFVRLMIKDQQQASTLDLSQSAYDSAQAGVEDAKRALLRYQTICSGSDASSCASVLSDITSSQCNTALKNIVDISGKEVQVRQNVGDVKLDQAYTCVTIQLNTPDFLGILQSGQSKVIPLSSTTKYDSVLVEWYSKEDISSSDSSVDLQNVTTALLSQEDWSTNRPSLLRAQFMQVGNNFSLSDFDANQSGSISDANTLFLYPVGQSKASVSSPTTISIAVKDGRRTTTGSPERVWCSGTLTSGGYACRALLQLPEPIGGGSRTALLRLSAFYNKTNYRVSLLDNGGTKKALFNAVQPEIDSTGRANDLFRRVKMRVELQDINFAYPEAAIDTTGNICKSFFVTDSEQDYSSNCTP